MRSDARPDHRPDQRRVAALRDRDAPRTNALVDLDLVEGHALQIAEARIAGTEIVERELHADRLQAADHVVDMFVVAEEHALGDFQLQPLGGKAGIAEHRPDHRRQRMRLELHRRQVDRDGHLLRPLRRFGAGGPQHPFADLVDQADFLSERDELRPG